MAADFSKPTTNSTKLGFPQEIVDNDQELAKVHEGGGSSSNKPVGTKRIDSDGTAYRWNGTSWDLLGYVSLTPALNNGTSIGETQFGDGWIELNIEGTGDRDSYVDFWSHGATADYDARIIRKSGLNGGLFFEQKGTGAISFTSIDGADFVFNPGLTDANFIAYGTSLSDLILWDASSARLGINTTSPAYTLDVNGDARFSSGIKNTTIGSTNSIDGAALQAGSVPASALAEASGDTGYTEYWVNTTGNGNGLSSGSPIGLQTFWTTVMTDKEAAKNLIINLDIPLKNVAKPADSEVVGKNMIIKVASGGGMMFAGKYTDCNFVIVSDSTSSNYDFHFGSTTSQGIDSFFWNCRICSPNNGFDDLLRISRLHTHGDMNFYGCDVEITGADFQMDEDGGGTTYNNVRLYGSRMSCNEFRNADGFTGDGDCEASVFIVDNSSLDCERIYLKPTATGTATSPLFVHNCSAVRINQQSADSTVGSLHVVNNSTLQCASGITSEKQQSPTFTPILENGSCLIVNGTLTFSNNANYEANGKCLFSGTLSTTGSVSVLNDSLNTTGLFNFYTGYSF